MQDAGPYSVSAFARELARLGWESVSSTSSRTREESSAWKASPSPVRRKRGSAGPVPCHDECRLSLKTPYDDLAGNGEYLLTWEEMSV